MSVCLSCSGVIGRDCWNPEDCARITEMMRLEERLEAAWQAQPDEPEESPASRCMHIANAFEAGEQERYLGRLTSRRDADAIRSVVFQRATFLSAMDYLVSAVDGADVPFGLAMDRVREIVQRYAPSPESLLQERPREAGSSAALLISYGDGPAFWTTATWQEPYGGGRPRWSAVDTQCGETFEIDLGDKTHVHMVVDLPPARLNR